MISVLGSVRRFAYGTLALAVAMAAILPAMTGTVHAYALVTSRSIKMSSSANGATSTSYEVGFTSATTGNIRGAVVDFCSNSPIIGDSCTAPTGFTVGTPTVATSGGSNTGLSGSWTAASANSGRTLTLKNATGGSVSSGTSIIFTLSTATNPTNSNTTFYARIFTFATDTAVDTWTGTADGSSTTGVVDAGGIALSTAAQITVTAKVQETLTFCVYTGANCAAGGTAVTLGNTNGVLSTAGPFVDKTTKYDVATNASGNAIVRLKTPATLTSGSNTITGTGAAGATSSAGTSQFGLCTYVASGSTLSVTAPYNNASCSGTTQTAGTGSTGGDNGATFALDLTTGGENLTTTYGDPIATATAGSSSTGQMAFLGNVSATQPAGVYTATFTFVATGTY